VSATEILFAFDRFSGLEGSGDRRAGDQSDEKIVIVRGASKYVASLNVFRIRRATFLNLGATVCNINCINLLRCFYQALPPNIPDGPPGSAGAQATDTGQPGGHIVGQGCVLSDRSRCPAQQQQLHPGRQRLLLDVRRRPRVFRSCEHYIRLSQCG
jgi:hypothetical protein